MDYKIYNSYVIKASRQASWINEEQEESIQGALALMPDMSALDIMLEQEILKSNQIDTLKKLIRDTEAQKQKAILKPVPTLEQLLSSLTLLAKQQSLDEVWIGPSQPIIGHREQELIALNVPPVPNHSLESFILESLDGQQIQSLREREWLRVPLAPREGYRIDALVLKKQKNWHLHLTFFPEKAAVLTQEILQMQSGWICVLGNSAKRIQKMVFDVVSSVSEAEKRNALYLYQYPSLFVKSHQSQVFAYEQSEVDQRLRQAYRQRLDLVAIAQTQTSEELFSLVQNKEQERIIVHGYQGTALDFQNKLRTFLSDKEIASLNIQQIEV